MPETGAPRAQPRRPDLPDDRGRQRVVIEGISPEVDCGRFPVKRVVGDRVVVEADVFADGHDQLSVCLLYRRESDPLWCESPMEYLVNDRWRGEFSVPELGRYRYSVRGWVDHFKTWRHGMERWLEAGESVPVELQIGALLVAGAAARAEPADAQVLREYAERLRRGEAEVALDPVLAVLMDRHPDLEYAVTLDPGLTVVADPPRAQFSTWYEMFPRSTSADPARPGTFRDVEARLPYVASMGFDVLYLPPIHPIGATKRKGKNNAVVAEEGAPGSPWAIGGASGGHTTINPDLGTREDFQSLQAAARRHGIELALDVAFQASPDHPYVAEHREWFRVRPDGTVQYAENPPKRYEDIYPFNFDTPDWRALWDELAGIFDFWIGQGVRIFRVDNPHTKPFRFWAWLISDLKARHPDVILLSESFTRPKVMYQLAKLGFTQSYTYFAWRRAKWEIEQYFTELTTPPVSDFFRPNLWPNTPDILTEQLQYGTRATFQSRLVLAAT
ncbi:MAG TPA: maltotransferase domain-containing protein, partial [Thermomicrobiaceae bacterium]|nr:maltotransferase domain-containing protein [Thermomicrobiaceae bacterium]